MQLVKIHTVQGNFRGNQIQIAADLAKVKLEQGFMKWTDLKSDANLQRNPMGQIPYLETSEGMIYQTNACLRYIARLSKQLYGNDIEENAQVDQWLDFTVKNFTPALLPILLKIWGFYGEQSPEKIAESRQAVENLSGILNEELKMKTYLVGNNLTIADIALFCTLVYAQRCYLDTEFRKKFAHLTRWYENLSNNPIIIKYFGQNRYSSKPWF